MFRISKKTLFNFNSKSNVKFIFLYYFKFDQSFFYFFSLYNQNYMYVLFFPPILDLVLIIASIY